MEKREIILGWLNKLSSCPTGDEIYIPLENKQDQRIFHKLVLKELKVMEQLDPITASQISTYTVVRDSRWWVVLKKLSVSPCTAFHKSAETTKIERVSLEIDGEQKRRLLLMIADGMTLAEIKEIEEDLTEELTEWVKRGLKDES